MPVLEESPDAYEMIEDLGAPADAYFTDDEAVAPNDLLSVVTAVLACRDESEEARRERDDRNKINYDAVHCRQDLSSKFKGQSHEFLPKVAMALEQFCAFVKRGLISSGDYFSVKLTPDPAVVGGPLSESGVVKLLRHRLENFSQICPGCTDFPTTISDGIKVGALGALTILKVCGHFVPTRRPLVQMDEMGEHLAIEEGRIWRLAVELVRPEDYYPDPTGRGLYEIHETRMDLYELIDRSEGDYPEYDRDAVMDLAENATHYVDSEDESEIERATDQPPADTPSFRKQVKLLEFWGTLLDSDGNVATREDENGGRTQLRNIRCTVANEKYLVRKPEPNPYWHQQSPFVVGIMHRVPFSVFHRGVYDFAVGLNLAMNEVFNLIIDGGIGAVWGVRQVKKDALENAKEFDDGIPQGSTMFVKSDFPDGVPVMQQLTAGGVPQDALAAYQLLEREFNAATMMSQTSKGDTPRKEVSATATASADQATGMFFDSIIGDIEQTVIEKALHLAWLTMLQNADDWNEDDTVGCIGPQAAAALQQMSPARRYIMYGQGARFRVTGLSSMIARTREFQKIMAALAALAQSPVLLQAFFQSSSPQKLLNYLFKCLMIDIEDLSMTEEEKATMEERMAQLPMFGQMGQGAQGAQQAQQPGITTEPGSPTQQTQAQISQLNQVPQGL